MNEYKTYFKFLSRNKVFTLVNLAGLSISLMFILLISNMVFRQLTVDKDMKDADRTYIMASDEYAGGHYNLGDKLQSRYPEIEEWCAISGRFEYPVMSEDKQMTLYVGMAKKNFFSFFGFPLLYGNPDDVLISNDNAVISRSAAIKMFGTTDCIGKTFKTIQPMATNEYKVAGIMKDIDNSVIPREWEIILPFENMKYYNYGSSIENTSMGNAGGANLFCRLLPNTDLNSKADDIVSYLKTVFWIYEGGTYKTVKFIPVREFYFSDIQSSVGLKQYNYKVVVTFIIIGVLVLLMAIFNYVSMSVAQTSYRAKEMATRRILGSSRKDIFWRMILESFILTAASFIISFILALAVEPYAMDLLKVKLDIPGDVSYITVISYILLVAVLAFASGIVPASILSGYNPMDVVKGTFRRKTKLVYFRGLNIFQSCLTIALLTCSFYFSMQIYRILNAPLGYEYGSIIDYPVMAGNEQMRQFRGEALKLPFVKRVSFACGTPNDGGNNNTSYFNSADTLKCMSFQTFIADSSFLKMFDIKITEDRGLGNTDNGYFVSEYAMKELSSIGQGPDYYVNRYEHKCNILGQFKDFKIRSLMDETHPLQMRILPVEKVSPWNVLVETTSANEEYKRQLDDLFYEIIGGIPFDSKWYHDEVLNTYDNITRLNKTIVIFTFAALIISLLGLTAMSLYFVSQRKRDISIRKVFGSNSWLEQCNLMKFSMKSLLISLVIAVPLIYLGIRQIDKFVEYDPHFQWWIPVTAFALVVVFSLGSVWLISLKTTSDNPVNNLKSE